MFRPVSIDDERGSVDMLHLLFTSSLSIDWMCVQSHCSFHNYSVSPLVVQSRSGHH